jgi:hypothetical protein
LAEAVAAEDVDAIAAKRENAASRAGNSAGIQEVRDVADHGEQDRRHLCRRLT